MRAVSWFDLDAPDLSVRSLASELLFVTIDGLCGTVFIKVDGFEKPLEACGCEEVIWKVDWKLSQKI